MKARTAIVHKANCFLTDKACHLSMADFLNEHPAEKRSCSFCLMHQLMLSSACSKLTLLSIDRTACLALSCLYSMSCTLLQTEFTPLHQWEREYIIFEQLHNKPHFMHFRLWKQFALWRRAVRVRKTSQARCAARLFNIQIIGCSLCTEPSVATTM